MKYLFSLLLFTILCTSCGISSSIPVKQVYFVTQISTVYEPQQMIDCMSSGGSDYGSIEIDTVLNTLIVIPPYYSKDKTLPTKIENIKAPKGNLTNSLVKSLQETSQMLSSNSTIQFVLTHCEGTDVDRGKTAIIVSVAKSTSSGKIMGMAITLMGSPGAAFYCTRYTINPLRLPNDLGVLFPQIRSTALSVDIEKPTRTTLYPMDEKPQITNPRQLAFIEELKEVLRSRDTEKIKSLYGEYITQISEMCPTSDSYDSATESYVCAFRTPTSPKWGEILSLVDTGCSIDGIFPWYENAIEKYIGEEQVRGREFVIEDGFTPAYRAGAVFGNNIKVLSEPSVSASIVGVISREAVCVDEDYKSNQWVKITTLDKKITGYVSSKYVFTPNTVRLIVHEELYQYQYNGKRMTEWAINQAIYSESVDSKGEITPNERDKYLLPRSEWTTEWKIIGFRGWD